MAFTSIPLLDMIVAAIVILILGWKSHSAKKYVLLLDMIFAFALIIGGVLLSIYSKNISWSEVQENFILSLVLSFDIFLWYGLIYLIIFLTTPQQSKMDKPLIVSFVKYLKIKIRLEHLPTISFKDFSLKSLPHFIVATLYNLFTIFVIGLVGTLYNIIGATIIATICYLINKNFYGKALRLRLNLLTFALCMGTYYVIITTLNHIGAGTNLAVLIGSIMGMATSYAASGKMYQYEPIVLMPKDMLKTKYKDLTIEQMSAIAIKRGLKANVGETVFYYIRMTAEQVAEKLQVQPRTVYRRVASFNEKEDTRK